MRALITNDDGVDSPGIQALTAAAVDAGLDVVVAAPGWDSSGASASLTAVERDGRLVLEERSFRETPDVVAYAVEAAPAFIVRAASTGAFGPPPEIVVSGINRGPNTGHAVLHSGTVGAALTASTFGMRAAAFSIGMGTPTHWSTAAAVARVALDWLVDLDARIVLNVNVPNVPLDEVVERSEQQRRVHTVVVGRQPTGVGDVGRESIRAEVGERPRHVPGREVEQMDVVPGGEEPRGVHTGAAADVEDRRRWWWEMAPQDLLGAHQLELAEAGRQAALFASALVVTEHGAEVVIHDRNLDVR